MDFHAILAAGTRFTDTEFTQKDALVWVDQGESRKDFYYGDASNDEWARASEVFPNSPLFGPSGAVPGDVAQGIVGDCWLLSSVSSDAQQPGRVETLFLNKSSD